IRIAYIAAAITLVTMLLRRAPWFWLLLTAAAFPVLMLGGMWLLGVAFLLLVALAQQCSYHLAHIKTASPCERSKAVEYRKINWSDSMEAGVYGAVGAGLLITRLWPVALTLLVCLLLYQRREIVETLRLWFCYPDSDLPGVCKSPCGSRALRFA